MSEWEINIEEFLKFDFINDKVDLVIVNYIIKKEFVEIHLLTIKIYKSTGKIISDKVVTKRFLDIFFRLIANTNMFGGINLPSETKIKGTYKIRQNEDVFKLKYLKL